MPPDDHPRERRARLDEWPTAYESVRGLSPLPVFHAGNDVVGLGSSRLWTFPHSPPLGNRAEPTGRGTSQGLSRSRERLPGPWIQAKPRQPSIALEKTSPAGAPPTLQATDRAVGRSAYARPEGEPYALAFFPSTPWTDANGSLPPVGRRLGISHPI
jgi:hypothetical protein